MTHTTPISVDSLVESIPDPDHVRGAIRHSVSQIALLRRLLRIAETRKTLQQTTGDEREATRNG